MGKAIVAVPENREIKPYRDELDAAYARVDALEAELQQYRKKEEIELAAESIKGEEILIPEDLEDRVAFRAKQIKDGERLKREKAEEHTEKVYPVFKQFLKEFRKKVKRWKISEAMRDNEEIILFEEPEGRLVFYIGQGMGNFHPVFRCRYRERLQSYDKDISGIIWFLSFSDGGMCWSDFIDKLIILGVDPANFKHMVEENLDMFFTEQA